MSEPHAAPPTQPLQILAQMSTVSGNALYWGTVMTPRSSWRPSGPWQKHFSGFLQSGCCFHCCQGRLSCPESATDLTEQLPRHLPGRAGLYGPLPRGSSSVVPDLQADRGGPPVRVGPEITRRSGAMAAAWTIGGWWKQRGGSGATGLRAWRQRSRWQNTTWLLEWRSPGKAGPGASA